MSTREQTEQLEENIVRYNEAARTNELSLYLLNAAQVQAALFYLIGRSNRFDWEV